MISRYRPSEISAISVPVTSSNHRNARNNPAVDLGYCTPFQMLSDTGITCDGTVCMVGNPARGVGVVKAMIRRRSKPFLFLGTASDRETLAVSIELEWLLDSAQRNLPEGNGAVLFARPYSSYLELCEYIEDWCQEYFLILHLGNGLQIGTEVLNLLGMSGQCLVICDSIPQSIRENDSRSITALEFMKKMQYLLVFSSGASTKDLVEMLPTYQYEKVSNTASINFHEGRSFLHPFHSQHGFGLFAGQTRTMEYKKSVFEADELKRLFDDGYTLVYNARTDNVYILRLI